jgi:hypothetical protein
VRVCNGRSVGEAVYQVKSPCECQALLEADLDANRLVVGARVRRGRLCEQATANTVDADKARFDVVWQCPMCGRNTLRVFYAGALRQLPADQSSPSGGASA